MKRKNETKQCSNLSPKMARPVERRASGNLFNAQPNGGVDAAIPPILFPLPFAGDDAE